MSSVAGAQAAPRHAWRELWLITIGHGLTHWYPATFYLLLPLIGNELGLSYSQIGLIITCQYTASAVANIPGGMMVDTIGRKGLLMGVSLFWVGFPYLLISFTHSYLMLLACIALVGFGNSLWHPTAIPTLGQRYPIESLEESLGEGIMSGHPDMPEFVFEIRDVSAILAYLKSIQESGRAVK